MRILVTGAEGFVGGHLITELNKQGHCVTGTFLLERPNRNDITWVQCDFTRQQETAAVVARAAPEAVIHLAAVSHVLDAEKEIEVAFSANVLGTANLLAALHGFAPSSKVIVVSSGEVYGQVPRDKLPISEKQVVAPLNLYGVTKLCAEQVARYYRREKALAVSIVRPFNQLGPGQADSFVCSSFARQVAQAVLNKASRTIRVGNLSVRRDFTDVRDMCRAYALAVGKELDIGPYNICSEESISIREILDILIGVAGIDIEVAVDDARVRSSDINELRGDCSLFKATCGWLPRIPIERSVGDTLHYWLEREGPSPG